MTAGADCPIVVEDLLAYLLDDLDEAAAGRVEEHLFGCDACARRLGSVERVREAVSDFVHEAGVAGNVNGAFLERAARDGLSLREYRIPAGRSVTCQAGPEDLVVVRLQADFAGLDDLRLDGTFLDLERGETTLLPSREVVADRQLEEVVLVFPGEVVRAYPRSRWTLRLSTGAVPAPRELAPFVMDHHP